MPKEKVATLSSFLELHIELRLRLNIHVISATMLFN